MISKVLVKAPVERPKSVGPACPEITPRRKRRGLRLLAWAVAAAASVAAYFYVPWELVTITSLTGGGAPPVTPPPRPIPVVAVAAHVGDMKMNINGLGSVTALYTVTLKSRVDGELIKVAFTEGQVVKKGTCWPRSIRALTK